MIDLLIREVGSEIFRMRSLLWALSWLLGLADYVYYFLKPRIGKQRRFFHEGYGNVASLRRLREHIAGGHRFMSDLFLDSTGQPCTLTRRLVRRGKRTMVDIP